MSPRAMEIIEDAQNTILVSLACAWEIAIKFDLGRLPEARAVVEGYPQHLRILRAVELAINSTPAIKAGTFDASHRDPFDRVLAAQSLVEGLPIISKDRAFNDLDVPVIW